jgi:hypothetical protein
MQVHLLDVHLKEVYLQLEHRKMQDFMVHP